jgi:hypothetical protein
MKLFNKTIDRQLFKQYALGSDLSKQEAVVKIFNPVANGTWFILNSDPEDPDYLWAIVDLGYGAEVGSVSRSDLETYRGRFGLGFERDLSFDPVNAEELYKGLLAGKFYAEGGKIAQGSKYGDWAITQYVPLEYGNLGEINGGLIKLVNQDTMEDLVIRNDNALRGNAWFISYKGARIEDKNPNVVIEKLLKKANREMADGGGLKDKVEVKNFADLKQGDVIRRKDKLGTTIFVIVKSPVQSRSYKNEYDALATCIVSNTDYYKPFEEYHITSVIKNGKLGNVDYIGKWNYDDAVDYSAYLPKSNKKLADGGEVSFIDYKDNQIMFEPNYDKYYANDVEFDSLQEAKDFLDSGKIDPRVRNAYSKGAFADGGSVSGNEVSLAKGYGYYDLSKYSYGNDFKKLSEPTKGKFIKGTVKVAGQIRVLLDDGREIITDKQAIDLPTYDEKDELYQQNKHLFSFGYADGGAVNVGYNVFNYTDNIYATDEVFKTKALANKFIKEFRSRFANQGYYRDNRWNKINVQDIDLLAIPSNFNPFKKFADGGDIENFSDNQRMIMNQNVEVEHHHEELEDILEDEVEVPAWVVAKMETATQNLSDITHYLDGEKELMEDENEEEYGEFDYSDLDDDDEIKNKEVVEPINVSAGTKAEMTKNFTDNAWGNLRGFLKGMEGIDLRDDYTFDYKNEQFEVEPIINSDENGVSNAVFTLFDGDGEEQGEVTYSRDGGKQKFTANSEFFGWNNAKFEDGGYFDGTIPKTSTYMSNYAKGGRFPILIPNVGTIETVMYKSMLIKNPDVKSILTDKEFEFLKNENTDAIGVSGKPFNTIITDGNQEIEFDLKKNVVVKHLTEARDKIKSHYSTNYAKGGELKDWIKGTSIHFRTNKEATERLNLMKNHNFTDNQYRGLRVEKTSLGYVVKFEFKGKMEDGGFMENVYADGGEIAKAEVFGLKRNIMGTTDIEMKISGMRKAQDFIVYPIGADDAGNVITIQSDTRIGQINLVKGVGVMSQSHSNGAYFVHLQMDKLTPFTISESDLQNIKSHIFKTAGDNVGSRGIVSDNSGASRIFAEGGGIGFIPMDLEETLRITAHWGGTDIKGVIGFLNAMIDSDMTDEDLKPKPTKSGNARQNAVDKKTREIWSKIESNYKGGLKGNMYYSTIYRLVDRANTPDQILKRFKPFRKLQKDSFADGGYNNTSSAEDDAISISLKNKGQKFYVVEYQGKKMWANQEEIEIYKEKVDPKQYKVLGAYLNGKKISSLEKGGMMLNDGSEYEGYNLKDINGKKIEVGDTVKTTQPSGGLLSPADSKVGIVEKTKDAFGQESLQIRHRKQGTNYDRFILLNGKINEIVSKSSSSSKEKKYILKADIKTVTVKRNGKEVTYKGADVLNGANVLSDGGDISSKANYIPKRDVVEVELKDGSTVKPVNGYWVKKGAEPIGAEPTPSSSGKSEAKINTTEIRKDPRGNWRAETFIENFNDYDWKITTIKTYSGQLLTSAQGGKTMDSGSKGISMFKYTMYEDPHHTLEVSQPKRLTEKVVSEQHDKGLSKFKKFMETGMFKGGGKISNFDKLSAKVAKQYEGKAVKNQYQEQYGKYYSKDEAQEVGDKVAGKVKAMQGDSKAFGGLFSSAKNLMKPSVKYPNLRTKQVQLKSGRYVQVFNQTGDKLDVIFLGDIGRNVKPHTINISEVDLTTMRMGGEVEERKPTAGSELMKKANVLAKEIRKDGESWLDARKRAFAQLKK